MLEELLVRVTTHWYDPRKLGRTQVLLGQIPSLPVDFPLPEGSRVLGTLIHGPEHAEIILDMPSPPEQVITFYKERLEADGWVEPETFRGHRQSGFTHAGFPGEMNSITLCKDINTPGFNIQAFSGRGTMTDVRIDIAGGEFSPCGQQRGPKSRRMERHGFYDLIPALAPPEGARQTGGGGSGGSDSASSRATLETDVELNALLPHYAKQLEAAGWIKQDEGQSGPFAWNAWAFQDEDNEPWHGTFFILKSPGKQREYSLYAEVKWDQEEKQSGGWFSYTLHS
jgi:hypothetical protein